MNRFKEYREIEKMLEENEFLLEGKTFEELKKKIKKWLENATENQVELLNNIWTRMNRDRLEKPISSVVQSKGLPEKDIQDMFRIISNANSEMEDKKELMEIIQDDSKLIQPESVTQAIGKTKFEDITPDELSKNETYQLTRNEIIQLDNPLNEARGKGETFITVFVGGVGNATRGDLALGSKTLEIKSSTKKSTATLRLRQDINAANNVNAKEELVSGLKALNPRADFKESSTFSFVSSEIKEWNKAFDGVDREEVIQFLKGEHRGVNFKGFRTLYPKMSDSLLDKYLNEMVDSRGNLDEGNSRFALGAMFFDYYKGIEGFDQMVIINTDDSSFITIESGDDIMKNRNIIKINNTSIWVGKEERHSSPEIGLV